MDIYTKEEVAICEPLSNYMTNNVLRTFEFDVGLAINLLKQVWKTEGDHKYLYHLFNCHKMYLVQEDLVSICVKYGMKNGEKELAKKIVSFI